MKTALTLFICLSFSLFSIGCFPLHAIDARDEHALSEKPKIEIIETTNHESIRCTTNSIDSVRMSTDSIKLFQNDGTSRTVPMDSVKYIYTKKFNTLGTLSLTVGSLGLLYLWYYAATNVSHD